MRVFAGLPLPDEIKAALQNPIDRIRRIYPHMSFVKPEGLHITMHFFGELTDSAAKSLISLMEDPGLAIKKIRSKTGGIGKFPKRGNPRVLFVGIDEGAREIADYYVSYHKAIARLGYGEEEREEFVPHITIARNKGERIGDDFLRGITLAQGIFFFDRMVLYKSELTSGGAIYTPLKTIMFN
jgi:RNA 2',3'-cyclic 3'-phosphodiesterase